MSKLHSTDEKLLAAAAGEPVEIIALTPDAVDQIAQAINERQKDIDDRYGKLVADCDYETKLAVTAWVFSAIVDHATEGGSFRHLIYDRLGFDMDAYYPLYVAGGMVISNEFTLGGES